MKYDVICLILIVLAFAGGFQRGIIRTFSFFIAIAAGLALTLMSASKVQSFADASAGQFIPYLSNIVLGLTFLILFWITHLLLRLLWKTPKEADSGVVPRMAGGALLGLVMLLSISVLTNFMDQSSLIDSKTKKESRFYGMMAPINEKTEHTWAHLRSAFLQVRKNDKS